MSEESPTYYQFPKKNCQGSLGEQKARAQVKKQQGIPRMSGLKITKTI